MNFLKKIIDFFGKAKTKVEKGIVSIQAFVEQNKEQIATAMKLADDIYDKNQGSYKMQSVIKFTLTAINEKCGLEIPADLVGTATTKFIEDEYQKIYESLKS